MSYWAEINDDNLVIRVLRGDNDDPAGDEGYQWLLDNLGGTWVKTSYNATIRKKFAGLGDTYDEARDAFIAPKPFDSWILNEDSCQWESPTPIPDTENVYHWDETTQEWIQDVIS